MRWFPLSGCVGEWRLDRSSRGIQESRKATASPPWRWRCSLKWVWDLASTASCVFSVWLDSKWPKVKLHPSVCNELLSDVGWCQQRSPVVRGAAAGDQILSGWARHRPVRGGHHESQHCGHLWDSGEGLGHSELHAGGYEGTQCSAALCWLIWYPSVTTELLWLLHNLGGLSSYAYRSSLAWMWRLKRSSLLTWSTTTRGGCGQLEIEASRKISRSGLFCIFLHFLTLISIKLRTCFPLFLGVPRP